MRIKRLLVNAILLFFLPLFCFPMFGFTLNGTANIKHNGKGSAVLEIESELNEHDFKDKLSETFNGFNTASGSNDKIRVENVKKTSNGYSVSVTFRRIDKVRIRGNFYWYQAEKLKAKQSTELDRLNRWALGDVSYKTDVFYDGLRGAVEIKKPRENERAKKIIKPFKANGTEMNVKNFAAEISSDAQMLQFQSCDTLGVKKITVSIPGTINYYGGENVKLIDENTFEVTSCSIAATVTKINKDTLEAVSTESDVNVFIGYVAFDMSMSPFLITVIIISSVIGIGLISTVLTYFYLRGKKCILAEEAAEERESKHE